MESGSAFPERRAGEGLICVAEVRITMIQGFTSPGSTIDMLIEFRSLVFRLAFLKYPILHSFLGTRSEAAISVGAGS